MSDQTTSEVGYPSGEPFPSGPNKRMLAIAAVVAVVAVAIAGIVAVSAGGDNKKSSTATTVGAESTTSSLETTTSEATTTTEEATTTTEFMAPFTMPNVVDLPLVEALAALKDAGFEGEPEIVESKSPSKTPGIVLEQSPEAETEEVIAVTLTVSALPDQTFLADVGATQGEYDTGVATVKGDIYTHGVWQNNCWNCSEQETTFTLSQRYTEFSGRVGVADEFASGSVIQVEIFDQDNKSLFKANVKVGVVADFSIDVSSVIQLKLVSISITAQRRPNGYVVWADPVLIAKK